MRRAVATTLMLALDVSVSALSCGQCSVIQEAIQRTIMHNISAFERKAHAGTQTTATIQIGQLIWHVCESEPWRAQRHSSDLQSACRDFVKQHVDHATRLWKEKSVEEYKDPALALSMKRSVCTSGEVDACEPDQLPDGYRPLGPDECDVCEALATDLYAMVSRSADRPTKASTDPYFRLVVKMSEACDDLPMRHSIRKQDRVNVLETCQDLWEEYEGTLTKLALKREESFARGICSTSIDLCDDPLDPIPKDEL